MDPTVLHLRPNLSTKRNRLLARPAQCPCKQPKCQALQPAIVVVKRKRANLLVPRVTGPAIQGPLEAPLDDVSESGGFHHGFVSGCYVHWAAEGGACLAEELA